MKCTAANTNFREPQKIPARQSLTVNDKLACISISVGMGRGGWGRGRGRG